MSKLELLKNTKTLNGLARLLGYEPKKFAYILYKLPDGQKYRVFSIEKKHGGERVISEPEDRLKLLQGRLASLLTDCYEEILGNKTKKKSISHGFRLNHSIKTNAANHIKKRYVFNIDLEDFFGSINFGRVRGYFNKDRNFCLNEKVSTMIAKIVCFENKLPQGSPTSPIISNLIGHILDIRILYLAKKYGLNYSRYADDITFSTNLVEFPAEIAVPSGMVEGDWVVGDELKRVISTCGFKVNRKKTSMQYRDSRQLVTGLVVNKKVNIRNDYFRQLRALCHSQFRNGFFFIGKPENIYQDVSALNKLSGMLNYVYEVRSYVNSLGELVHRKDIKTLYEKYIIYRNFLCNKKPLIVCEGKTDYIYLKSSIESLNKKYPKLVTLSEGRHDFLVSFFKSSKRFHDVTGLPTGTNFLKELLCLYKKHKENISNSISSEPVIFIVDDDNGAGSIINRANIKDKEKQFHHFYGNLYIVLVPVIPDKKHSDMEDCFSTETLGTVLDGREFNRTNDKNTKNTYSKAVFAQDVVLKNKQNIDFSGFVPLLDRIQNVIDYHSKLIR